MPTIARRRARLRRRSLARSRYASAFSGGGIGISRPIRSSENIIRPLDAIRSASSSVSAQTAIMQAITRGAGRRSEPTKRVAVVGGDRRAAAG